MRRGSWWLLAISMVLTACGGSAAAEPAAVIALDGAGATATLSSAEAGELERPVLVYFHADWCHVCKKISPVVDQMAITHDGEMLVVRINVADAGARAALDRYEVRATPTFVLIDASGMVLAKMAGWPGESMMEETIQELIALR